MSFNDPFSILFGNGGGSRRNNSNDDDPIILNVEADGDTPNRNGSNPSGRGTAGPRLPRRPSGSQGNSGCSQSRNFSFGYEIGIRGEARKLIEENTRTVEGIYTAQAVVKRACELGIEMPICEVVNKVLFAGISIKSANREPINTARPHKPIIG